MYDVIIPCYKINEKLFTTTIKSIYQQKIKPHLIIIIIDGYDPDFDIVKRVINNFDLNFKVFINKNNLGIRNSLNIGLNISNNQIIFRIDADDEWLSNHTEVILRSYEKNGDAYGIYYSLALYKKKFICLNIFYISIRAYLFGFNEMYFWDNIIPHSGIMINRNVIKNFNYSNDFPEDFSTLSEFYKLGYKYLKVNSHTILKNELNNSFSRNELSNKNLSAIQYKNINHLECSKEIKSYLIDMIVFKKSIYIKEFLKLYSCNLFNYKIIFFLILLNIKNWLK